jgi:hypothetical protein
MHDEREGHLAQDLVSVRWQIRPSDVQRRLHEARLEQPARHTTRHRYQLLSYKARQPLVVDCPAVLAQLEVLLLP